MPAGKDATDWHRTFGQPGHDGLRQDALPVSDPSDPVNSPPHGPPAEPSPASGDRWLCSELVSLCWADVTGRKYAITVNLEEIWREGAQVEAEEPLPEGLSVCLTKDPDNPAAASTNELRFPGELRGVVSACLDSGTGFAVEIAFAPGHAWEPDSFPPSHGVNTAELERKATEAQRQTPAAGDTPEGPGSVADREKRASAARAVSETIEQGSLYHLVSHAANR